MTDPRGVPDPVRHGWVQREAQLIHYLDFGGDGPTVVCIHGVTSCAWIWHHVARCLRPEHRVVAVDLRGHGGSGWAAADRYRTLDHASDVQHVIATVGGGAPVDLVGSSWGALVALAVAAEHPEMVTHLGLVDVEPSFALGETDVAPRPSHFESVQDAAEAWRIANPSAPGDLLDLLATAATRPAAGGLEPAHDPLFLSRWPFRSEDWWDSLDAVATPALVLNAGRSWVRPEVCDAMAARLARAERATIAESAHVVPVDAPDRLGAILARFLEAEPPA